MLLSRTVSLVVLLSMGPMLVGARSAPAQEKPPKHPDVIYVPTPQPVVDAMLELAAVKDGDVVYDLGCGDGRIVVTAATKYRVKATGIDIDPERIKDSNANVEKAGVKDEVTIKQADLFEEDFSDANVVTLYLLPTLNERLKPQLEKLKEGSRVVTHSFPIRGWKPKEVRKVTTDRGERTIYLYVAPFEKEA